MKGLVSEPDNVAIRAELTKIVSSPSFVNSPRMVRFLKYVVETTLEGKGALIKEYVIALDVFEKSGTYDSREDSTVRTEASKLRARLGRYYESEGREDPVIISIPKGAYLPAFESRRNGIAPVPHSGYRPTRVTVVAVVLAAASVAAGAIVWFTRPSHSPPPRLVPLTSYPGLEEHPSLSPDGSEVAFCWKGNIYVKPVGAEAVLRITNDPAVDSWPAWSPDGSQIAFVRNGQVLLVSPLGGRERSVSESAGRVAWTPDGSALLVLQKASALGTSVFRVTLATREKRRLTFPSDLTPGDLDMAISPDGRTVAFCRVVQTLGCELFVIPASGGEARQLTNDRSMIYGMAWTPEGREILFASTRQNSTRLWRIPAIPAMLRGVFKTPKLVEAAGDDATYPSISRSSRLAYQHYTRDWDIVRAEITGREGASDHRLHASTPLIASTRLDTAPAWSPDGRRIVFISDRSGYFELWICDADGSNPIPLTAFGGPGVMNPRWSSDSHRLIFSALTGPNSNPEGYFIDANGGAPERIGTPDHRSIAFPILSRDERSIYFIPGPQERAVDIWKIPSAGGAAVRITKGGAFQPQESTDGKLLYYGRYGTHGLWCVPTAGGEERQVLNSISGDGWTIGPRGIYYFDFLADPRSPKLAMFYSFETGRSNQIGTVEPTVLQGTPGISVSPNGRWLLYTDVVTRNSDLMLVDHL